MKIHQCVVFFLYFTFDWRVTQHCTEATAVTYSQPGCTGWYCLCTVSWQFSEQHRGGWERSAKMELQWPWFWSLAVNRELYYRSQRSQVKESWYWSNWAQPQYCRGLRSFQIIWKCNLSKKGILCIIFVPQTQYVTVCAPSTPSCFSWRKSHILAHLWSELSIAIPPKYTSSWIWQMLWVLLNPYKGRKNCLSSLFL